MPFKFKHLVELLHDLDQAQRHAQNHISSSRAKSNVQIIKDWFTRQEKSIVRHGPSAVALLSCFLLNRLPHRTYRLKEKKLASILCKVLGLSQHVGRGRQLFQWEHTGLDFSTCLEKLVMADAENEPPLPDNEVTLEEIDAALQRLASCSGNAYKAERILRPIILRLQSIEAKWFLRMILKSYEPVEIPEHLVLGCFHFLLPQIMSLQTSIEQAVQVLEMPEISSIPHDPPFDQRHQYRQECVRHVIPRLGTAIHRQDFELARGIGHCCKNAGGRKMSVERKYDGWYCQVHIDLSKGEDRIQLFSKRGKNFTKALFRLHNSLEASLRLHYPDCAIRENCILEGEMLVWNRVDELIQPFHKIRKYVEFNGRGIGAGLDSPKSSDDHLMIIFYDCLWHDNRNFLVEPHRIRKQQLEHIVTVVPGMAQFGDRQEIDFGSAGGRKALLEFFAHAITERWEGLVLKGCNDPYFSTDRHDNAIKLKKDYIKGLGDHADLCIIGGRRDATDAERLGRWLRWTTLYLACLKNKEDVVRYGAKPLFLVLRDLNWHCVSQDMLEDLNRRGIGQYVPFSFESEHLDIEIDQPHLRNNPPAELFRDPFIVEVLGAGFDRPNDVSYYELRFPRVAKVHFDRGVTDTHSFDELQELAKKSFIPADPEEQGEMDWCNRLVDVEPQKHQHLYLDSQETQSPSSISTSSASIFKQSPIPIKAVEPVYHLLSSSPVVEHTVIVENSPTPISFSQIPSSPAAIPEIIRVQDPGDDISATPSPSKKPPIQTNRGLKRKAEGLSLSPTARKRPRAGPIQRALIPLKKSTLKKQIIDVNPYDPPAVFLSPYKAVHRNRRSPPTINKPRQPCQELENISPTHGLHLTRTTTAQKSPTDNWLSAKPRKPTVIATVQHEPISQFPFDEAICTALWPKSPTSPNLGESETPIYIKVVDIETPHISTFADNVRREIYGLYSTYWHRLKRSNREYHSKVSSYDQNFNTSATEPQAQKRLILFYDPQIRPLLVPTHHHSSVTSTKPLSSVLMDSKNKQLFLRGLLIEARTDVEKFPCSRDVLTWKDMLVAMKEVRDSTNGAGEVELFWR